MSASRYFPAFECVSWSWSEASSLFVCPVYSASSPLLRHASLLKVKNKFAVPSHLENIAHIERSISVSYRTKLFCPLVMFSPKTGTEMQC